VGLAFRLGEQLVMMKDASRSKESDHLSAKLAKPTTPCEEHQQSLNLRDTRVHLAVLNALGTGFF
jgi:hypothetical protein